MYRCAERTSSWPIAAIRSCSGTSASARRVPNVCLRSCGVGNGSSTSGYAWQYPATKQYPNGKIVPFPGRWGKPAGGSSAGKGQDTVDFPNLDKGQVQHLRSGIAAAFYGVPEKKDVGGKVTQNALPKLDYEAAIEHAVRSGYSRAGATRMANRFYQPGDRGRPGGKPAPYVAPLQSPGAFGFQAVG